MKTSAYHHNDIASGFRAIQFDATEEQVAFARSAPKWVGIKVLTVGATSVRAAGYQIQFTVYLSAIKGNSANETGVKRIRKFLALYGERIVWAKEASNSYETQAAFEAAL